MSTPSSGYICRIYNTPGHWIQHCPFKYDPVLSQVHPIMSAINVGAVVIGLKSDPNNNPTFR